MGSSVSICILVSSEGWAWGVWGDVEVSIASIVVP